MYKKSFFLLAFTLIVSSCGSDDGFQVITPETPETPTESTIDDASDNILLLKLLE